MLISGGYTIPKNSASKEATQSDTEKDQAVLPVFCQALVGANILHNCAERFCDEYVDDESSKRSMLSSSPQLRRFKERWKSNDWIKRLFSLDHLKDSEDNKA